MGTIGIVGANGKVGTEVTLLLGCMEGVTVAPVVRSEYAGALLRQSGVVPRVVGPESPMAEALADCDLVADFSLSPGGVMQERRARTAERVHHLVASTNPKARFAFMSSTMAFGMGPGDRTHKPRRIGRTAYSVEKRRSERDAVKSAAARGIDAFVLRLGEVHGDMQPVTADYVDAVRAGAVRLKMSRHVASNVVTCFTVANALRNIARGVEVPGRYTLVEQPDWTWEQVFNWVAASSQLATPVFEELAGDATSAADRAGRALDRVPRWALQVVTRNKELITANLPLPAWLEYRLKIRYLARKAAAEVARRPGPVEPRDQMIGPVPGRRLTSREGEAERSAAERCVRHLLDTRLGPASHLFPTGPLDASL